MAQASGIQGLDVRQRYAEKWGWHDPETYIFKPKRGLSAKVVEEISRLKSEPEWMRQLRGES